MTAAFTPPPASRYAEWYAAKEGAFILARKRELLSRLLSGWSRRSRSLLVVNAGDGLFLEGLWDSGFEVTGQEREPELLAAARGRMGTRAELTLAAPDHLPFEDREFDYAVLIDALEFLPDPAPVLREVNRVACCGLIVIVPNAWSLLNLSCRMVAQTAPRGFLPPLLQSPRKLYRLLKESCDAGKISWASTLAGPACTWKSHPACLWLNSFDPALPLGGLIGCRVDFGPVCASPPLFITTRKKVAAAKEAASLSSACGSTRVCGDRTDL